MTSITSLKQNLFIKSYQKLLAFLEQLIQNKNEKQIIVAPTKIFAYYIHYFI